MSKRKTRAELERELEAGQKQIKKLEDEIAFQKRLNDQQVSWEKKQRTEREEAKNKRVKDAEAARALLVEAFTMTVAVDEALVDIVTTNTSMVSWRDRAGELAKRNRQVRAAIEKIIGLELVRETHQTLRNYQRPD